MSDLFDVLVVGGGMAGAMAALAARVRGASVVLIRRAPGATALSSGGVGVAHEPWSPRREPLASRPGTLDAARRIAATRPSHPYGIVGAALEQLEDAMAFAAATLSPILAPPGARGLLLSTPYGSVTPCALAQRTMVAGDLPSVRGLLAVVGFRGHLGFDARLVAGGLAGYEGLGGPRTAALEIDLFMREEMSVARPHELARALELPGAADEAGQRLARALPRGAGAALFPPVLGLHSAPRVVERIAAAAGVPVAETLSDVPSVPGLRLQAALDAKLVSSGVEVIGGALTDVTGPGSPVRAGGREIRATSWILATGRFVGGGIARRGRLTEPLLGLPVEASEAGSSGIHLAARPPEALTLRERRAPQPLLAAGIRVDAVLRPLRPDGTPLHPNLFAAGGVIGGHEPATDGSGLGTAILTGYLAGREAYRGR